MKEYRLFTIAMNNQITGVPRIVVCENDEEAIRQARQAMDGKDIEIWEGPRLIIRLKARPE